MSVDLRFSTRLCSQEKERGGTRASQNTHEEIADEIRHKVVEQELVEVDKNDDPSSDDPQEVDSGVTGQHMDDLKGPQSE